MPERYSLKMPSKWFRLFHQKEQTRLILSGITTTWQVPTELNGNIWCSIVKGYHAFMCDEHRLLSYRFIGLNTTNMKDEQMAILCPERSKCAPVFSVHESVVTFHWCSVYLNTVLVLYISNLILKKFYRTLSSGNNIWTASSEFGTYRLCEQRRFRWACASAQSRQNLRYSLIQAVSQEEPSDRKPDPWSLWMAGHAQLEFVMTECSKTQIRLARLIS